MEQTYQLAAFGSLAILIAMLYALGYLKTLRPSALFFVFFLIQYGPIFLLDARHTQNEEFISTFSISDFGPTIAQYTYAALAISYLGLSIGLLVTEALLNRGNHVPRAFTADEQLQTHRETFLRFYLTLIVVVVLASIAFLSVSIVRQKLAFFYSLISGHISAIDYATFRRVTLTNDPNSGSVIRLRMNFSMPLMALITAIGFYIRRPVIEMIGIVSIFSVIAIIDLTKQGTLVAALIFFVCVYLTRRGGNLPKIRDLAIPIMIVGAAGVALLFGLYAIQYLGSEQIDASVLWQTLFYRVTRSNADGLNLYFVFFKHPLFEQGISTSTMLATFFHKQSLDETSYIPQLYGAITSFPTVYFSGMWVDFGWTGIALSSVAVGAICSIADYISRTLVVVPVRAAYVACVTFTLNYFGQVQFFTSLSTYGIISVMVGFSLLDYLLYERIFYNRNGQPSYLSRRTVHNGSLP